MSVDSGITRDVWRNNIQEMYRPSRREEQNWSWRLKITPKEYKVDLISLSRDSPGTKFKITQVGDTMTPSFSLKRFDVRRGQWVKNLRKSTKM